MWKFTNISQFGQISWGLIWPIVHRNIFLLGHIWPAVHRNSCGTSLHWSHFNCTHHGQYFMKKIRLLPENDLLLLFITWYLTSYYIKLYIYYKFFPMFMLTLAYKILWYIDFYKSWKLFHFKNSKNLRVWINKNKVWHHFWIQFVYS